MARVVKRSWILWMVILTVIAYGAFKGLAWYHVNRFLLQLKSASELHLAIRHGWIGSSLTGEITVHDVEVTPFQLRKPLFANEVVIRFNSVFDMLHSFPLFGSEDQYKLPEKLEIEWKDVELPLSTSWSAYLPDSELTEKFFGLACGRISSFGVSELSSMGYGVISHSAKIGYDYEQFTDRLALTWDAEFTGIGRHIAKLDLQLTHALRWPPRPDALPPRLDGLQLSFEDKSFLSRVALLCGKQGGYDQQEFIKASLQKTKRVFARAGIAIKAPLLDAYGTFLEGDSVFEVFFEPNRSVDLSTLPSKSADEIAQTLNYSVSVNRVRIPEGDFLVNAQKLTDFLYPPPKSEAPPPKPVIAKRKAIFQELAVEKIDQFTGRQIRIKQRSGKTIEGVLTATEKHRVDIDVPQAQGKVLVHLDKFDIAELWVLSDENLSKFKPAAPEVAVETKPEQKMKTTKTEINDILNTIDQQNTEVIYEDGTDINTPLAEGEYFEIIEIEEPEPIVNPTINDIPADDSTSGSVARPAETAPAKTAPAKTEQ